MVTQLHALRIDVIFGQYFTPSIKDYERYQGFESAQLEYTIQDLIKFNRVISQKI